MRFFLLFVIALFFLIGGVVMAFGVDSMMSRHVSGDDIKAAILIGVMSEVIGVLLMWAAFRVRKAVRAKAPQPRAARSRIDGDQLTGTLMGMVIGTDLGDDSSDDFGD